MRRGHAIEAVGVSGPSESTSTNTCHRAQVLLPLSPGGDFGESEALDHGELHAQRVIATHDPLAIVGLDWFAAMDTKGVLPGAPFDARALAPATLAAERS